jgi:hypothetical protein
VTRLVVITPSSTKGGQKMSRIVLQARRRVARHWATKRGTQVKGTSPQGSYANR